MPHRSPYELLGVPRDATAERIRRAYEIEIARAHRDGAHQHAVALSGAYDILSDPTRRALYERHGLSSVRERSPGAAPLPTPWRTAGTGPARTGARRRRRWRAPLLAVFALGIAVGLLAAGYLLQAS